MSRTWAETKLVVETIRQRTLTKRLGQVTCRGPHDAGWALCVFCGAQV